MKLNLLIASVFASVALVACGDSGSSNNATTSSDAPAPTVESTNSSNAVVSTTASEIPPICAEYFAAIDEFVAKYPEIGNTYQEAVATTKKQIEDAAAADKDSFAAGCQASYDAFKEAVASMPQ
ncbi:MAG: DUF5339 family protein [Alcaligenaceae bacterium]|nr:DUF5339 family protein [Alcaligenaceae bacterium]